MKSLKSKFIVPISVIAVICLMAIALVTYGISSSKIQNISE